MTGTRTTGPLLDRLNGAAGAARAALIGYLPIGFPTVEASAQATQVMIDAGADIVELGLPYTDPVMDGPVIQHAVDQALRAGTKVADSLRVLEAVAGQGTPILVMTYWNLVLRYGVRAYARDLAAAGGAGLITPDLIPDEAAQWIAAADEFGLDKVFLVAPSSTPERLSLTAAASRGFVYAASTMGVTGTRSQVGAHAQQLVAATRAAGAEHVCVGLGVSTAAQAAQVAQYADGVIVGSALVKALGQSENLSAGLDQLASTTAALAAGVRSSVLVRSSAVSMTGD